MTPSTDLLAPIPGANPAGAYLRFEPVYDQIKEARREDDDLPQGDWETARKAADWPLVIRLASEALSKRSKDLQLAAWLTEAMLRKDGIAGLRRGLDLLGAMLEQYWDTVYPELEDGDAEMRAGPLEWVGVKLDTAVRMAPINADGHSLVDYRAARSVPTKGEAEGDSDRMEARELAIAEGKLTIEEFERSFAATPGEWYRSLLEDIEAADAAREAIDHFCRERFGDVAPSFLPLREALQEVRQVVEQLVVRKPGLEPEPGAPGTMAGEVIAATAGSATASVPTAAPPPAAAPRNREEAAAWIAAAAAALRRERPTDPAPYLMVRGFRWGELRGDGGAVDPRLLVAPSTELRSRLKALCLDGRWLELLDAAEAIVATPQGRGWLDLQRYVVHACDALGDGYDAVGSGIRGALRMLITDLPELVGLTLMDDSPTASADTLEWLREEGWLEADAEATDPPPERRRPTARRDAWDVARERAEAGDARGAMEMLMREAMQEKSARARFLRRAQAADIMVGAGLEAIALPMLREMLAQVEAHRLEEWEAGETVARPFGLLYRCVLRLDSDEVDRRELYDRICRLDPVHAVQLGEPAGGADEGA